MYIYIISLQNLNNIGSILFELHITQSIGTPICTNKWTDGWQADGWNGAATIPAYTIGDIGKNKKGKKIIKIFYLY